MLMSEEIKVKRITRRRRKKLYERMYVVEMGRKKGGRGLLMKGIEANTTMLKIKKRREVRK